MEKKCCVRGYHVYSDIWEAVIGEELDCRRDPSNAIDRYAVAVVKSGTVVGHSPRRRSTVKLNFRSSYYTSHTSVTCIKFHRTKFSRDKNFTGFIFATSTDWRNFTPGEHFPLYGKKCNNNNKR